MTKWSPMAAHMASATPGRRTRPAGWLLVLLLVVLLTGAAASLWWWWRGRT